MLLCTSSGNGGNGGGQSCRVPLAAGGWRSRAWVYMKMRVCVA